MEATIKDVGVDFKKLFFSIVTFIEWLKINASPIKN